MPSHRARGFGRFVAVRTAVPRHAAAGPARRRRLTLLLVVAGLLGTLSAGLLALRLDQAPRASAPQPRLTTPSPALRLPPPYRPRGSTARAVRQAAKPPPVPAGDAGDSKGWRCHHDAP